MSTMVILLVGIFVTALCGFGLWFTIVELQRLSRHTNGRS
jgi:hypothetical protein